MALEFDGSGAMTGALAGAKIGTMIPIPVVGTVAGGLIGGAVGGLAGNIGKGKENSLQDQALKLQQFQQMAGVRQMQEAQRLQEELDAMGRPQMQAEVNRLQEVADISQRMAREGMPEAQREAAASDIQASQAMQLSAAGSLGAGLRGLGTTQATTAQQYRDLNVMDAQMARQNQQQYLSALGTLAGAEGRAEAYNTLMPYEMQLAEMQALKGAGLQNVMGGLQTGYDAKLAEAQMAMERKATGASLAGSLLPAAAQAFGEGGALEGLLKK